jgi:hypothetical protein
VTAVTQTLFREFVIRTPDIARALTAFLKQHVGPAVDRGTPLRVTVRESAKPKSRDQEAKYHAMFGDIAKQCEFMGKQWDADDWKRLLVDAFYRATKDDPDLSQEWGKVMPRMVPSLDGSGVVQLGAQTRRFTKKLASAFIEYLYAWGAEQGVQWSGEWEAAA